MKILVLTQYFWPESFRINDLVRAWSDAGHEVTVLTGLPNYPAGRLFAGYSWRGPYRESYARARVVRLPVPTRGPKKGLRLLTNYVSFVALAFARGPAAVGDDFDLVFVYAPSPISVALPAVRWQRRRRTPVALWVQDLWPDNLIAVGLTSRPILSAIRSMTRRIYRTADLVLVQSEAFVDPVRQVCPEVRDVRVLPNWADAFYRPETLDAEAPERREMPEGFTIMFAGNLGSAQALGTVLDAAERLRDSGVYWVFVGDGRERASLEAATRARGLATSVRFLGWKPAELMPRYLALADVALVSLRRSRAFASTIPAKLQSSLAAGLPVLAALEGEGARVVREAEAGLVVEPEHAEALASAARALFAAGPDARGAMGARGRAYAARHFDRETLVARLDGWLRALAERTT